MIAIIFVSSKIDDLSYLPSRGVVVRSERAVRVASNHSPACHALYVLIEGGAGRYIGESLTRYGFCPACRVGDDLGELASGDVIARAERAVGVAPEDATAGEAPYEGVEG